MVEKPLDLFNNSLHNLEEFEIKYDGPSFDGRMALSDLRKQLKSTDFLIKDLVDELHSDKQIPVSSKDIKVYLRLKKGSFQEIISVALTSPIIEGVIIGCIVGLFNFVLSKNKKEEVTHIKNITNNYYITRNITKIVEPLTTQGDILIVSSVNNPNLRAEINFDQAHKFKEFLKEIDRKAELEIFEEEFFGYLSAVDVDKEKFAFTLEGSDRHIPAEFESHLNLAEIKSILAERIKIVCVSQYKRKVLSKIRVKKYELKKKTNLNNFM